MGFAEAAVAVFFVLSGFVIRYVTTRRSVTFSHYLGDRASRIYSVTLPALAFTVVAAWIAHSVNPAFYKTWVPYSTHPLDRLLENIFFTAQCWTQEIVPFCNSPFWSLSYEVVYYVLYGCAFYLRGWKRIFWIALTAIVAGPKILLLFPVWLIGCLAHDLYQNWVASGRATRILNLATAAIVVVAVLCVAALRAVPGLLHRAVGAREAIAAVSQHLRLGMAGGAIVFYPVGIIGTVLLLRLLLAVRDLRINSGTRPVTALRFIAEGTFPIYLLHFPLFVLIAACIPYNHASSLQKIVVLLFVLAVGVLAGHPLNILKRWMRALPVGKLTSRVSA